METEQDQTLDLTEDQEETQAPGIDVMAFPNMEMPDMKLPFCAI